jgi:hypothetical protein
LVKQVARLVAALQIVVLGALVIRDIVAWQNSDEEFQMVDSSDGLVAVRWRRSF